MQTIKTPILPTEHTFARRPEPHDLNVKAICVYIATGFFMDDDTFWNDVVCLRPGHHYQIDDTNVIHKSEPWFHWSYDPKEQSFEETLDAYIDLLTSVTKDQISNNDVILPLSGGLDSRSQAAVLRDLDNRVHAYSYKFDGGYPEDKISAEIAKKCGFEFSPFTISKGYLWNCIDDLAGISECYSEFTHPRQMGVYEELKSLNGVFSLGHWGDVFFDRGVPEGTTHDQIVSLLLKKMVKPSGKELAKILWKHWNIEGDFEAYLIARIESALSAITIDNVSAKVRAFKTTQWAHRWTTTNLSVFRETNPITLPFYDDRICQFVCTVSEDFLADRKLQLAHLKRHKDLASITWHAHRPFSILNYQYDRSPYNLPYRIKSKLKRTIKSKT